MKNLTTTILIFFLSLNIISQNNAKESWSFGIGLSNFTMQGDLTSLGTSLSDENNSLINFGGYLYADKMFSPVFGLEIKGHYTKMAGASQELSTGFIVEGSSLSETYFEGNSFGAEINTILNFSNIVSNSSHTRRLNIAGYLGWGIHTYDSKLINALTEEVIVDFGDDNEAKNGKVSSNYYSVALGLKYKINDKFDFEFRPSININEEDHLDAAVTNKQALEFFYQTNFGIVFKLNDYGHDNLVWQDNLSNQGQGQDIEMDPNLIIDQKINEAFKDSDGDGVIDRLDKEPNSPKGAVVYGNGVTVDIDKDGVPDFKDLCPTVYAETENGCPSDKDGDGVLDKDDECPNIKGEKNNNGCPKTKKDEGAKIDMEKITSLSERIFFNLDSFVIKESSISDLDEIADIMIEYPEKRFLIEGHTDLGGKRLYNLKLSVSRANVVLQYLIRKGVNPNNLKSVGFGYSKPKYDNKNDNLRTKNRRVDIKLIKE